MGSQEPKDLESAYIEFSQNIQKWAPDGIIQVDLETLYDMGLLNRNDLDEEQPDEITANFHVSETPDKITLHNEKFAIWIVPKLLDNLPVTHTFISQFQEDKPHLELVFATSGVYNTPKFILKVLHHFLLDVVDTENIIAKINKKPPKNP
jgi:hypothetical protein